MQNKHVFVYFLGFGEMGFILDDMITNLILRVLSTTMEQAHRIAIILGSSN